MIMIIINNVVIICHFPIICESDEGYFLDAINIISYDDLCSIFLKGERIKVISNALTCSLSHTEWEN